MRRGTVAFVFVLLLPLFAPAAPPVCALLDPGKSPRAALLEAKLLADPGATWAERDQIDKVLGEQKLAAVFGPQGVGDRVKLGRLLKADVLVMVREVKDSGEPALEVVVSETGGGLRILVRGVPLTKDAATDAAALFAAVRDGIRKHGEKVTEVVAVPPFVTKDLELEHDHLKGAYARLTESAALGRPGVVVVELEEAQALAKEIALAAPGMKIDRPLPVYLLGEYRNEGRGKDRTVTLNLRAERGGKLLGKLRTATVKPDAAPAGLREWATGVLNALATDAAPKPAADPKTEAKLLTERAMTFRRLGYRTETLALAEASLLLDPNQPALHLEAVKHLSFLTTAAFGPAANLKDVKRVPEIAPPYLRALAHIEDYVNTASGLPEFAASVARLELEFRYVAGELVVHPHYRTALEEEIIKLRDERRAVYLRIVPVLAQKANGTEAPFVWATFRDLPRKDRYAAVEALVAKLEALPNSRARAVSYICADQCVPADRPEFRALVARWAASEKAYLREASAELKAKLEAPNTFVRPTMPDPEVDPSAPGPGAIALKPVALIGLDGPGDSIVGGISVGPTTDLVWTTSSLYLMTEKGKLRLVWAESGGARHAWKRFSSVSADGKFVWVTCERLKGDPVLLVLDPVTGKVWDASTAEGLPRPPAREKEKEDRGAPALMACALEPGRACLAGYFSGRSWVGIADFDAKTGTVTVKVTHEAREVPDVDEKDQWKKTTVGCHPSFVALLTGPAGAGGKAERRVLIGRIGGAVHGLTEHPLVVRPDGVVEGALETHRIWNPPAQDTCVVANGALYYLELYSEGQKIRTHLARVGLPGPTKDILCAGLPQTPNAAFRVTVHGNKAHAVIEQWHQVEPPRVVDRTAEWWTTDLDGKNPKRVATGLPGMRGLWTSAHYGLVALVDHGLNAPPVLNTVELVTAPPKVAIAPKNAPVAVVPPKPVGAPPKAEPEPKSGAGAREPVAGEERAFEIAPGVKMVFCYVPPGKAQLGSPKAERALVLKAIGDDREPGWLRAESEEVRGVFKTNGFWMGKYEVTQTEWTAVMGTNPSYHNGKRENPAKGLDTKNFPVESVSWNDCQKFLGTVNKRPGAAGAFGRAGQFCLPHEDEWEYACRGGKGNDRAFYWGGELNGTQANSYGYFPVGAGKKGVVPSHTLPVGSYAKAWPHPWGLCDMHGNVWEWCENEFDDVTHFRLLRGGANSIAAYRARAADRWRIEPFSYGFDLGFRVCFRPVE